MKIGDIARSSREGTLFGDVQTTSYWDSKLNNDLAKGYIFTNAAGSGLGSSLEVGSFELLERMIDMYQPGKQTPNRMMAIANYGHGKSHFAVAAANYFGKSTDSSEYLSIQESLAHSSADQGRLQQISAFRAQRAPFFVVIIRGDKPGDLPTLFNDAVVEALRSHPETSSLKPPFWTEEALRIVDRFSGDQIGEANKFLQQFDHDLNSFRDRLRANDDRQLAVFQELFQKLNGVRADLGSSRSLADTIDWLASELCGSGKMFGGALVIFDELTAFLGPYGAGQARGHHPAPLQDLLTGVSKHRGKVGFIALGIQDPRAQLEGISNQGITKELERLEVRVTLRSVLEQVLNAYIKQDEDALARLPEQERIVLRREIEAGVKSSYRVFVKRYRDALRWDESRLYDQVGWGCFPLHPLTTATLSSIKLSATTNARSVLRFVEEILATKHNDPILVERRANWSFPIELVDYFGEMLVPTLWERYQSADEQRGADAPNAERRVLKAMLLIEATAGSTVGIGYDRTVAEFAGLDLAVAKTSLQALASDAVIQRIDSRDQYTFFQSSSAGNEFEKIRKTRLGEIKRPLSREHIQNAFDSLFDKGLIDPINVGSSFGPQERWESKQVVSPLGWLEVEVLKAFANTLEVTPGALNTPKARIIWAFPQDESESQHSRVEVQKALGVALGEKHVPIVVMVPGSVPSAVLDEALNLLALQAFDKVEIERVGAERYEQALKASRLRLVESFNSYQRDCVAVVPPFARESIGSHQSPSEVLASLYRRTFVDAPAPFLAAYPMNRGPIKDAVSNLSEAFAANSLHKHKSLYETAGPAKTIVEELRKADWRLISSDYKLQAPAGGSKALPAWNFLDQTLRPGNSEHRAGAVLQQLLNPPFGYDERSLMLLFSAWWGRHRHELELLRREGGMGGVLDKSLDGFIRTGKSGGKKLKPDEFFAAIAGLAIRRRPDPATEADAHIEAINSETAAYTISEAQNIIALLTRARVQLEETGQEKTTKYIKCKDAIARLASAKSKAELYETNVADLVQLAGQPRTDNMSAKLVQAAKSVTTLDTPKLVRTSEMPPDDVRAKLNEAVEANIEFEVSRNERLSALDEFSLNERRLTTLGKLVETLPKEKARVLDGLQRLTKNREVLEQQVAQKKHDETVLTTLRVATPTPATGLADLTQFLKQLHGIDKNCSPSVRQQVAVRRLQIEELIQTLSERVESVARRLDMATSDADLTKIETELNQLEGRIAHSQLEPVLQADLERVRVLRSIMRRAESVTRGGFSELNDASASRDTLNELLGDERLSSGQIDTIQKFLQEIDKSVAESVAAAKAWLAELGRDAQAGANVHDLKSKLRHVPRFLSESDVDQLRQIRTMIDRAVDADLKGKIESEFARISDKSEQQALAERLFERAFGYRPATSSTRSR